MFDENKISYEDFCDRYEEIIEDSNLILRVRDQLYDWRTGAAIILSELVFGKGLESKTTQFQQKVDSYGNKATNDNSAEEVKISKDTKSSEEDNKNKNIKDKKKDIEEEKEKPPVEERKFESFEDPSFKKLPKFKKAMSENPNNKLYLQHLDHEHYHQNDNRSISDGEVIDDEERPNTSDIKDIEIPLERGYHHSTDDKGASRRDSKRKKKYKRTLFLTSEELKKMNLRYGKNEISYTVDSGFQGTQTNTSRIFFWNHKVKIVISDVDGTITKSDVLGHVLPRLGKDWSHNGVTELFTNIRKNGYEFLYLTSRAIGMADSTRGYLQSLEQASNFKLPDGP